MASGRSRLISSILAGVVLLASAIALLHIPASAEVGTLPNSPRTFVQFSGARDGDLIFRQGRDMVSRLIMSQGDNSRYSHVGVIVHRGTEIMVIHAMPGEGNSAGGVIEEPLSTFASFNNAVRADLYRYAGISVDQRKDIGEYLQHQIGKPFDGAFSMTDDGKMYCAELAVKAYRAAGINLTNHMAFAHIMTLPEGVVLPDSLSHVPGIHLVAGLNG